MNYSKIIIDLQRQAEKNIDKGYGPFLAAIYDEDENLIAQASNSVIRDECSNNHAEMNTIRIAEKELGTYDLSKYNLTLFITAEPCIMCAGAIIWSGIKRVVYSVSTKDIEEITGFDEGFKPNWIEEFNKRGIEVIGAVEEELGKEVLRKYVLANKVIYKPKREK